MYYLLFFGSDSFVAYCLRLFLKKIYWRWGEGYIKISYADIIVCKKCVQYIIKSINHSIAGLWLTLTSWDVTGSSYPPQNTPSVTNTTAIPGIQNAQNPNLAARWRWTSHGRSSYHILLKGSGHTLPLFEFSALTLNVLAGKVGFIHSVACAKQRYCITWS